MYNYLNLQKWYSIKQLPSEKQHLLYLHQVGRQNYTV